MKTNRMMSAAFVALGVMAATSFAQPISREFRDSVTRQVDRQNLQRDMPAKKAPHLDRVTKSADTIIGWYDKGHNYHAQKMNQRITPKERIYEQRIMRGRSVQ